VLLAWIPCTLAQTTEDDLLTSIAESMQEGEAPSLFDFAARQVDMSILGEDGLYSRSQGTHVLRRFFSEHPPIRFAFTEVNDSPQRRLLLGHYWAKRVESPFSVFIYIRKKGEIWEFTELRIEIYKDEPGNGPG
jgi:hypothetical protein